MRERTLPGGERLTFDPEPHVYELDGDAIPSVTQVLNVLHKPALVWWGMVTGVEGLCSLDRDGHLGNGWAEDPEATAKLLTEHKLTVNHVRDKAGVRGSAAHRALEDYAKSGKVPRLDDYPDEERGYIRAIASWIVDTEPEFLESEVMVASVEHRYAGTLDVRAVLGKGEFAGQTGLIDAKSSKRIYPDSHFPQLAAYELASVECGYDPTDYQAVLRVAPTGKYELRPSCAEPQHFVGLKCAYDAVTSLKAAAKAQKAAT